MEAEHHQVAETHPEHPHGHDADRHGKRGVACRTETALAGTVSTLCDELMDRTLALKTALQSEPNAPQEELVRYYHDVVFNAMSRVRDIVDQLEQLVDKSYWPFPNYTDLLFSV